MDQNFFNILNQSQKHFHKEQTNLKGGQQIPDNISDEQLMNILNQNPQILKMMKENPQMLQKELEKLEKQAVSKHKPMKSQEYLKIKNIESYLDEEGGIVIEPDPVFVFKTQDIRREKIFINITSHPLVDEPEEKYLVEIENQMAVRVPMSVGKLKEDYDKKGDICKVVDVIINPNVAQTALTEQTLKGFLIELLVNYLQEKFKISVVEEKTKFSIPKMKYKGKSIEFQRVKGKKAPKIEQMAEQKFQEQEQQKYFEKNKEMFMKEEAKTIQKPEFTCYTLNNLEKLEEFNGNFNLNDISLLIIKISLPILGTGKYIDLELSSDELYFQNKQLYRLILKLPFQIQKEKTTAIFNIDKHELEINMMPLRKQINIEPNINLDDLDDETLEELQKKQEQQAQQSNSTQNINLQMTNTMLYDLV